MYVGAQSMSEMDEDQKVFPLFAGQPADWSVDCRSSAVVVCYFFTFPFPFQSSSSFSSFQLFRPLHWFIATMTRRAWTRGKANSGWEGRIKNYFTGWMGGKTFQNCPAGYSWTF
jgi:hypothetical protein